MIELRCSSASVWMECLGYSIAVSYLPKSTEIAPYAVLGTDLHAIAEKSLITKSSCAFKPEHTDKHKEVVQRYISYIDEITTTLPKSLWRVEQKLNYAGYDGLYGTADFIAYDNKAEQLIVADLKTGFHKVNAFNNKQLLSYASLFYNKHEETLHRRVKSVKLAIVQTNREIDEHVHTFDDMYEHLEKIHEVVETCKKLNRKFHVREKQQTLLNNVRDGEYCKPSAHNCKFCPLTSCKVKYVDEGGSLSKEDKTKSVLSKY